MDIKAAVQYCLNKPHAEETYPFDETTLVLKVGGKMFGLVYDRDDEIGLNLKCDPASAIALREKYSGITPGYHMNKQHWNTVIFNRDVPDDEIYKLMDYSYEIVYKSLTEKQKTLLQL